MGMERMEGGEPIGRGRRGWKLGESGRWEVWWDEISKA